MQQMSQPVVVAYVQPSKPVPRYRGAKIRRGKLKVYRGGKPVKSRELILRMAGRRM